MIKHQLSQHPSCVWQPVTTRRVLGCDPHCITELSALIVNAVGLAIAGSDIAAGRGRACEQFCIRVGDGGVRMRD